jgi:phosphatidylglycerol---prolipoprotein diacylglyceryl transferase
MTVPPGFITLLGFLSAWLLARRQARIGGIATRHVDWMIPCALVGLVLGAALYHAWFGQPGAPQSWLEWLTPHGAVHWALLSVAVPCVLYCLVRKVSVPAMADIATPAMDLSIAFARVGCFVKGCCWGDVCVDEKLLVSVLTPAELAQIHTVPLLCHPWWPLAVRFPRASPAYGSHAMLGLLEGPSAASLPCHPVQLYEAAGLLLLTAGLVWLYPRRRFPLQVTALSGIGYGALQFLMEFVRADHQAVWRGLTTDQVICLAMVIAGMACYGLAKRFLPPEPQRAA